MWIIYKAVTITGIDEQEPILINEKIMQTNANKTLNERR